MRPTITLALFLAALFLALQASLLLAQQPTDPAPRWPDGHVNLGSMPDKKGYWETRPGAGTKIRIVVPREAPLALAAE